SLRSEEIRLQRKKSKTLFSVRIKSTHRRSDFIRALARIYSSEKIYSTVRWISLKTLLAFSFGIGRFRGEAPLSG
ncbi:MAG: hypothetical protein IKC87_08050, partial [Clostridia bacterium]|nr:hypothetical protein [Clostridia bacterium]